MPITIENLDEVEAWTGSAGMPIPVGEHIAEIDEVEEKPAGTGSPQIIITWRVVDGMHRDATSREWLVIVPPSSSSSGTYGKVRSFLNAVHWPIGSGTFVVPTFELKGRRAQIVVREDTYDGKTRLKVVAHNAVPSTVGGEIPMDMPPAAVPAPTDDLPF